MRGRFCTQPFLVERSACHPNAFLLPLRWVSRSPPHPPQCTALGHLWFMVASPGPDRTVPRTVRPPRGRLWGWVRPFPTTTPTPPSPPSRWAGRYGRKTQGRRPGRKKEDPRRVLQTRVGSPEGRNSPLWPSSPPFLGRNGGPRRVGALRGAAPRGTGKAPTTRRVRSTAPLTGAGREPPK